VLTPRCRFHLAARAAAHLQREQQSRLAVAVSLDLKFMARSAALYAMRLSGGSYLNMSRRLVRWMKRVHLPITPLRMRYVRLVHVYHILDNQSCSHHAMLDAKDTLLAGYVIEDEGDDRSSYCVLLCEAIAELQGFIVGMASW
jgi:hypothetical protein